MGGSPGKTLGLAAVSLCIKTVENAVVMKKKV